MKKSKLLIVLLTLTMVGATACSSNSGNNSSSKPEKTATNNTEKVDNSKKGNSDNTTEVKGDLGKYTEPIEIKIAYSMPANAKFPAGESMEKNKYFDIIEKELNIKFKVIWTAPVDGDGYMNKLNLSIASNDLPDIFVLNGNNKDVVLKRLVDNDMIEDLTNVYKQYDQGGEERRQRLEAAGNKVLEYTTFNDKLMAIPDQLEQANASLVWVRQDWLDKLKLPAPKTIDDFVAVAKAFKEQDPDGNGKPDTFGVGLQNHLYSVGGDFASMDGLFSSYNVFPALWVKDSSGKTVWGGIQPEAKEALGKISEMYKAGLIDKEFATKDNDKVSKDLAAGKIGMEFQPWWAPFWPLNENVNNFPQAEWRAYPLLNKEGQLVSNADKNVNQYLVVRKGYEHPEALMKLLNFYENAAHQNQPKEWFDLGDSGIYKGIPGVTPLNVTTSYIDGTRTFYKLLQDVVSGTESEDKLDIPQKEIYKKVKADMESPKKDITAWQQRAAYMYGAKALFDNEPKFVITQFGGTTDMMAKRWQPLLDLQLKAYYKIIISGDISYFDKFVNEWKSQGGDKITEEVQSVMNN